MPFKLSNDETRLIVHNECLYKLKLTYKSELSLTKSPSSQKNEVNRELTKVIRAVLFLIKTEKHIPRKIHTPCFTVYVTVKFWKIALKLGFSKNGSRLKCGHLIQLTLYTEENQIQQKESSKRNAQVNSNNKSCLEKKAKNENLELVNHMGLRQFVINSDDSDSTSGASSECVRICSSPKHSIPATNVYNNSVSTGIDCTTENFRIPESQLNQTKSSDQTPMISDQTVQALSNSAQLLNELLHSSHSPKEASDQDMPVFISSCTQTDPDELDFCANNPDLNSRTLVKAAVCHVQSDHDYLKSLAINHTENTMSKHAASNSNKESTNLQDKQFSDIDQRPSVTNVNSSLCENNEGNGSSVSDDDDDDDDNSPGRSHSEEVSSPAEFVNAADKVNIETLNAEQGDTFVDSLSNQSHSDHQDKNDVWGIESKQLDVVSEVEIPMESHSESSQDDITGRDNSKHFCWSKNPSKQYRKKVSRTDDSEEQAVQNKNSSNTERTKSPSQKVKNGLSKKLVKATGKTLEMVPKNRSRMRSLRSYKKVDNIPDRNLRKSKSNKKLPKRQVFSSLEKKTPNKKTCEKQLPSNSDKCKKKAKQENRIPKDQTEISYGLHDRYQVQTQELQEDLKLQNLAHPSSSSMDRKKRSFLEYINFGYFLRRGKKTE